MIENHDPGMPRHLDHGPNAGPGTFAGIGLLSSLGVGATKSCCLIPIALAFSGMGETWLSQAVRPYEPYLLALAAVSVVTGWSLVLRAGRTCRPDKTCGPPPARRWTIGLLGMSTALTALLVAWGPILHPLFHPAAGGPR